MLKSDLHIHTREELFDTYIKYSARDLIDIAAKLNFKVLSITNHNYVYYNRNIASYAKKKGILLIPGAEISIDHKHVLVYGVNNKDISKIKTFDDLCYVPFVIAPHPFFKTKYCLGKELLKFQKHFDAIEYSHFHTHFFNLNKTAVRLAKRLNIPMFGNSDAHTLTQFNKTYSLVESEPKMDDVFEAIRKFQVKVVSKPLPIKDFARILSFSVLMPQYYKIQEKLRNI